MQDRTQNLPPQLQHFLPMVGTFTAEVLLYMGPGDPMRSTGTMINSWDLGASFMKQDYNGDPSDGPFPNFEGRGYFGYNPTDERYEGFWIDTASRMMQMEQGQVDATGKVWEMHSEFTHPESKQRVTKRTLIRVLDPRNHRMESMMTFPGQAEMKVMVINFTRKDAAG